MLSHETITLSSVPVLYYAAGFAGFSYKLFSFFVLIVPACSCSGTHTHTRKALLFSGKIFMRSLHLRTDSANSLQQDSDSNADLLLSLSEQVFTLILTACSLLCAIGSSYRHNLSGRLCLRDILYRICIEMNDICVNGAQ